MLYVRDPEASAKWYCDILGMQITARNEQHQGVFLSFGHRDHDIALFPAPHQHELGRHDIEHVGLQLEGGVPDLKEFHGRLVGKSVKITEVLDHGVSYGVYFLDPDGHQLEVFAQLITDQARAMDEIGRNRGKADPIGLEPAR